MDLNSPFEPKKQHEDTGHKIAVALSKLSDLYRQLLWSKAQPLGISPIQAQLMIHIRHHDSSHNTVSHLAKVFQMTKATVSDSVRVLVNKGLLQKVASEKDKRSFYLELSASGRKVTDEAEGYTKEIQHQLGKMDKVRSEALFKGLYDLLDGLNQQGVIPIQRMCFGCAFYQGDKDSSHHCTLLKKNLQTSQIRLDCAEFEAV